MTSSERTGPLSDIRIVDLTQALAGPFGTGLLADLGADVVKIEPPSGDMSRLMPPRPRNFSLPVEDSARDCDYGGYFGSINRNKRSVVLDLKQEADRDILLDMVEHADAVVENARVGVMDRLGIGYETMRERNRAIVYAAVRGFGDPRTGKSPYADWPAFDIVAQCMGGLVGITGPQDSLGFPNGASIGDIFPGTLMALGLVSAVHAARRSGEGQFVDVSMYDAVLSMAETIVSNYSYEGKILDRRGSGHPYLSPFDVYETSDGAVAIAAPLPNQWEAMCKKMGREDLIADERTVDTLTRSGNREFTDAAVLEWTRSKTKREVVEELGGIVPVGAVHTAEDIFQDPHAQAREMLPQVELPGDNGAVQYAGTPIKFSETKVGVYRRPPALGEHTEEVLAELGIRRKGTSK